MAHNDVDEQNNVVFDLNCPPKNMNPADSIIPIIGATAYGVAEPIGSGILIQIGSEVFLITATHVFDDNKITTTYIYGADDMMPLTGHRHGSPDTAFDVCYFHLSEVERNAVLSRYSPLPSQFVEMSDTTEAGDLYTFVGYPEQLQLADAQLSHYRAKCFGYTTQASRDRIYRKLHAKELTHIVLDYSSKRAWTTDGKQFVPPSPHCMSGGAVWKRFLPHPHCFRPTTRLCGIAVLHHPSWAAIKATRINLIMEAIRKNHPSLARFIAPSFTLNVNVNNNEG